MNPLPNNLFSEEILNNITITFNQLENLLNSGSCQDIIKQKEYSILKKILKYYEEYHGLLLKINNNLDLAKENVQDPEFIQLIKEENQQWEIQLQELYYEFNQLIYEDNDENIQGISVEIRGATGGREAALFAYDLMVMYEKFALRQGWKVIQENINKTTEGGIKEGILIIKNSNAYNLLKYESGVHRVQRVPETESKGRVHTSTATIAVLPLLNKISDIHLDQKDIQIDVYRASGAGGQHVNTTESAVRLTHIPTGTVVIQQDERSQHKNKEKAMGILKTRVMQKMIQSQMEELCNQRLEKIGKGQRCEKIRTYNFPQDRVTDHRINYSVFNILSFMEGEELEKICKAMDESCKVSILEKYK